jgi:hypothetical protein
MLVISNSIESTNLTTTDIQNFKASFRTYLSTLELSHQAFLLASNNLDYEETNKDILTEKQSNVIKSLT